MNNKYYNELVNLNRICIFKDLKHKVAVHFSNVKSQKVTNIVSKSIRKKESSEVQVSKKIHFRSKYLYCLCEFDEPDLFLSFTPINPDRLQKNKQNTGKTRLYGALFEMPGPLLAIFIFCHESMNAYV